MIFERNNYYYGKLMTVRDFSLEQSYFNEKRWLINREVNGWGVVCGLDVKPKENVSDTVIVSPGLAIDHNGREVWVNEEQEVALDEESTPNTDQENQEHQQQNTEKLVICIKFQETETEPTSLPPIVREQKERWEFNRIRESYEILVKPAASEEYFKPPYLVLAEVTPSGDQTSSPAIDYSKRSFQGDLPRVTNINWDHGGEKSGVLFGEAIEALEVTFNRKMEENTITTDTFLLLVKIENPETGTFRYEYVPGDVMYHYEEETETSTATFTVDPNWVPRMSQKDGEFEFKVVLKGDFILSAEENGKPAKALDGNFVGGNLPSGNGTQGGDFVSWFWVIPFEQQQEQQQLQNLDYS